MQIPSQDCQNTVPAASTNGGEQKEFPIVHPCQSCGNGDQVTDDGNKSASQCGGYTVIVKIFLTLLDLLLVQQAHLSPFAVGELIDNRSADIKGYKIVDTGTDVSSQCCIKNDEKNVQ